MRGYAHLKKYMHAHTHSWIINGSIIACIKQHHKNSLRGHEKIQQIRTHIQRGSKGKALRAYNVITIERVRPLCVASYRRFS